MPEVYVPVLLWLALQTVMLIAAWARVETRIRYLEHSLDHLWKSYDQLHPRQGNPGERDHTGHNHEKE